ncbi:MULTISPECIES: TonB-dependent receptor [Vibrio]|uniref:TonB-dependent receptor n=1 Tax=Vibrio TaxID=662 RepID=UPI000586B95C|nr:MULTISPECIES: TonB-dependent receptor [Vibrio]MCM5507955.1 TonB-dependent receptor [Vibrio sp. SCSIO 43169]MDE3897505.1 TonB-dependent receptor [Vibrio sp. CC007]QFT39164.1 Pesticin receptor precursor [Vibrio sp. THAF64]QGM36298.1 Pesticin receptor precursor [Vibrio sp. THAF191d]QGN71639.1 Pesticin receptor precursor [Vibrio sp. THAF191c]
MYRHSFSLSPLSLAVLAATLSPAVAAHDHTQEVMIIEATKQDIPLERVDNSVLIKTGEELEKAGIHEVKDLEKAFPGLMIQTRGNRTYANTTIRGVSSPDYYSPTVSIYVDGVLQDSAFLTQQLMNVEQVELLRGPQGTLYGGNAQGGIINIITKKATDETVASAGVSYSNLSRQIDGSAAVAISETTYADFAIRSLKDEGNIRHIPSNTDDANETEDFSGTARFHYLPEQSPLSLTFSVSSAHLDSHEEWYLTQEEYNNKATSQNIPELKRVVNSYALNVGYDLGTTQLTSITAYQNRNVDREYIGGKWVEDQNTFSQEVRANTQFSDDLSTLVGGYYENRRFDVNTGAQNDIKTDTYALFGQANYALTDSVDLTGGLRASRFSSESDFGGNSAWMIDSYQSDKSENVVSPKAAVGWQVDEDSRIFASLTSGYRPGGFSPVPRSSGDKNGYDAEKSLNGELGWRTILLDHTLHLSGALYWIDTNDIQLYTGNPGSQVLRNMGDAQSKGIELDLAYYPTDDLTLTLGATFGQSTFESGNDDIEGKTLPYAPDTTAVAGIEYYLPQTWVDGDISIMTNARYTSKIYFDENNTVAQDGYTLVDLAIQYAMNENLSFRLFSNNLTDKEYVTYAYTQNNTRYSNYGTVREVGVNMKLEW